MAKRISKRVREEAAFGCQAAASTHWNRADDIWAGGCSNIYQFFWSADALSLAEKALEQAIKYEHGRDEVWAEAESLLRCGWSPGDEP